MIIQDYSATAQDLGVIAVAGDAQSNAQCSVTIPANTQYSYTHICQIIAGYAGAGTGALTITGTVGGTTWVGTWTITGLKGGQNYPFPAFDAGQTITITLGAGGAVGFLVIGCIPK